MHFSSDGQANLSKILLSNLYEAKPGEKCALHMLC